MSTKSIFTLVEELPKDNLTVKMLHALDFVVPGEWHNLVGFEETIRVVTGESDQELIQQVGDRAIKLFNDRSQGYQRALWLYQTIDRTDQALGAAVMADKAGNKFGFLSFLKWITPKADHAQMIDLSLKLTGEVVAFCLINGIPGDSVGDFVKSLADYSGESIMRMSALVCVDGLIPLGPDFARSAIDTLEKISTAELEQNETFQKIRTLLPGENPAEQLGFMRHSMASVQDWMQGFIEKRNLDPDKVIARLKDYIDIADDKLDYLGAFLDMTTNYYEHTGTQTLARRLIQRAVNEI